MSIRLASLLHTHVTSRGLGEVLEAPVDVILSDTTVVQPDIVFIATDRHALVSDTATSLEPLGDLPLSPAALSP